MRNLNKFTKQKVDPENANDIRLSDVQGEDKEDTAKVRLIKRL